MSSHTEWKVGMGNMWLLLSAVVILQIMHTNSYKCQTGIDNKNADINNVLFYVVFLQTGARSLLHTHTHVCMYTHDTVTVLQDLCLSRQSWTVNLHWYLLQFSTGSVTVSWKYNHLSVIIWNVQGAVLFSGYIST